MQAGIEKEHTTLSLLAGLQTDLWFITDL